MLVGNLVTGEKHMDKDTPPDPYTVVPPVQHISTVTMKRYSNWIVVCDEQFYNEANTGGLYWSSPFDSITPNTLDEKPQ